MSAPPLRTPTALRARARGMSLIEVMIALVLLSFGLMGLLGLKLASLKMTGQSHARSVASMHAAEIIDRMRTNPTRAVAGQYNLSLADPAPAAPADIAQVDLAQWRQGIGQNLPSGSGSVAVQPDGTVRVVVQWSERADALADPQTMSFAFEARL